MAEKVTVYTYAACSTCRAATKWLDENAVSYEERPIRETPPTVSELKRMLAFHGGEIRKLFNTSGLDYKGMGLAKKLPSLTESEALELLASNGRLVKRPFVLGKAVGLQGFKSEVWKNALVDQNR